MASGWLAVDSDFDQELHSRRAVRLVRGRPKSWEIKVTVYDLDMSRLPGDGEVLSYPIPEFESKAAVLREALTKNGPPVSDLEVGILVGRIGG